MHRGPAVVFEVHVAGEPGADHVQRCVPCGAVLLDNRGWWEGRIAVPDGDDGGPSWWPAGSLVATDKTRDGQPRPGASMTYVIEAVRDLDDDERPCTSAR